MSQFVKGDLRSAEFLCGLIEDTGDIVRVIGSSVFPCENIAVFILVGVLEKGFIFFLLFLDLQKAFFSSVKQVQNTFAGMGLGGISCRDRFYPYNGIIDGQGLFFKVHC